MWGGIFVSTSIAELVLEPVCILLVVVSFLVDGKVGQMNKALLQTSLGCRVWLGCQTDQAF